MGLIRANIRNSLLLGFSVIACVAGSGCGKSDGGSSDSEEMGQQIGDVMASIDESGGSAGILSINQQSAAKKFFARVAPRELEPSFLEKLLPTSAEATSCSVAGTFGACTGGTTVTRSFAGCTVGSAVFTGTVTFNWSVVNACQLAATGDSITRVPAFSVTGRRGATLNVSKAGTVGQRITWTAGAGVNKVFSFSNDGIRRVFTSGSGSTLLDFTTTTPSNITITGTTRSNRVVSGGTLRVTNNLTSVTCDYVPAAVSWSAGCNCASSGTWTGTCSNGSSTTVSITGCGSGTITVDSTTQSVSFDRCGT